MASVHIRGVHKYFGGAHIIRGVDIDIADGEFAVLVALIEDGIPVLGVVHGPALGVTYTACGPGTATRQRNGGAIEVRPVVEH